MKSYYGFLPIIHSSSQQIGKAHCPNAWSLCCYCFCLNLDRLHMSSDLSYCKSTLATLSPMWYLMLYHTINNFKSECNYVISLLKNTLVIPYIIDKVHISYKNIWIHPGSDLCIPLYSHPPFVYPLILIYIYLQRSIYTSFTILKSIICSC